VPVDSPTPLATSTVFTQTAWSDLAANLQAGELDRIMIQATRACESACKRRLAPFTNLTETHRAEGIDPDEYGSGTSSIPMDLPGTVGRSYANALGSGDLVRHMWLSQTAPQFQEFWTYTINKLTIVRSYGGSQDVLPTSLQGPEPDTGHLWFQIGTFLPVGSQIRVNYSGGYSTVPGDLESACLAMAASIVLKRLDPDFGGSHDPDLLRDEAIEFLNPYMRD
jgi:hypothetical protein